jgi:hypothetical protein
VAGGLWRQVQGNVSVHHGVVTRRQFVFAANSIGCNEKLNWFVVMKRRYCMDFAVPIFMREVQMVEK